MKSALLVLAVLLALIWFTPAWGENAPERVSLEDAKKFAITHNFEVLSLRRAVEEVKAKEGRAGSPFFPKLGIAGGADSEITSTGSQGAAVGYLFGNYNLFSGFEDTYRSQMAGLESEKAAIRLERAEFRVGLEVERAFHLYIFKKTAIDLKNEAIQINDTHRKMAAQKRSSGMASESDIIEFDLRNANLKSDLLLLQQELEETRTNLKKVLGEEVGSQIEPLGSLQHQHLKGTVMEYINKIKTQSEVVILTAKNLAIGTVESKLWKAKWLPKVDIEARAGYLPLDIRPEQGGASVGGLIIAKLDLFSGFDTMYEKRELEARRLRLEAELKDAILTAITQTQNAYRSISTIQLRVDLEEENEHRAKKYYESVMSEYRRGVKNSQDLKVAADGLFETALRAENYKFEFLNQRIELEKALGGPVETEVIEEKKNKI